MAAALTHMDGPFRWGRSDCCTAAAAAFHALWGVDPMGPHGYRDAAGARAVLARAGGWHAYTSRLATQAGLVSIPQIEAPLPGAIGLVETGRGLGLGLCIGPAWAVKARRGVAFVPHHISAWRTPCPQP